MPTILVVEYDEGLRLFLQGELEGKGFNVIAVTDGLEAVKVIDDVHVDLITLDMKMPGIDGMELLTAVARANEKISVVLFSDYLGYERNIAKYRKFRIEACIQRSLDTTGLKKAIDDILSLRSRKVFPNRAGDRALAAAGLR